MNYKIDIKRITDGKAHIQGWVLPKDLSEEVSFYVTKKSGEEVSFKLTRLLREDVAEVYLKDYKGDKNFGFDIVFDFDFQKTYNLIIKADGNKYTEKINKNIIDEFNTMKHKKNELIIAYLNKNTFKRAFEFLMKEGPISFIKKAKRKLNGIDVNYDYSEWYELTKKTDEELENERKKTFNYNPFFSIVIPLYDTNDEFLRLLFKSLLYQTYQNFEICVADATDYNNASYNPKKFFERLVNGQEIYNKYNFDYNNLHIKYLNENKSIAENTNEAINMAKGDYIVLCDHDDELTLDALYENAKVINDRSPLFIYSDEDKVDTKDSSYFEPAFKPDFNLDMLLSVNYFCHLSVIKSSLLKELYEIDHAYERKEYNGAQDYDLFLRLVNLIIKKHNIKDIYHIRKVLYHWRCHKKSTSVNVSSKEYAFKNGAKAVEDFIHNTTLKFREIDYVEKGFDYGLYHTIYKKFVDEPLLSVVIPNKDHIEDLKLAISSVTSGEYKNIEFIICENNSTKKETFEYYEKLKNGKNIKVVYYDDAFNYSKINNFATRYAGGKYLLFLNNDVEMINKNSISEMMYYILRDDVGAVGAKLLYKDKSIQHAGVVIGFGGIAGHTFIGINDFDHSYMNRSQIVEDYNAVTAACLLTKKEIFEKVGGFNEDLAVAFNDIDFCLKIRKLNKLIVYNPYSSFFHYESKTRGLEDNPEKVKRFNDEYAYFVNKWRDVLDKQDEYYNPNLTLRKSDFSLRNLKYENIGESFPIPDEIKHIIEEKYKA